MLCVLVCAGTPLVLLDDVFNFIPHLFSKWMERTCLADDIQYSNRSSRPG